VDALIPRKKSDKGEDKIVMNLINHDQIEKSLNEGSTCYALVAQEAEPNIEVQILGHITPTRKSSLKSSEKICSVSCLPWETFNMSLT